MALKFIVIEARGPRFSNCSTRQLVSTRRFWSLGQYLDLVSRHEEYDLMGFASQQLGHLIGISHLRCVPHVVQICFFIFRYEMQTAGCPVLSRPSATSSHVHLPRDSGSLECPLRTSRPISTLKNGPEGDLRRLLGKLRLEITPVCISHPSSGRARAALGVVQLQYCILTDHPDSWIFTDPRTRLEHLDLPA
jgi:hypothetical protein